ncbi:YcaO-like family protein [Streptomyces sp. NBC_00212]|uniref:YcaO-like family protein n=1 Tax=Streptomyces sp. NBC_00212 TaxID=2975684 RepID=UPI002F90B6E5
MPSEPIYLDGTVRARVPHETWAALVPLLPRYGITRVARLTGLDYVGMPVWTAIRPTSQTLTATQGKGASDDLAKISAVMEGIELWHAEQPLRTVRRAPAADLDLPYPLAALPFKAMAPGAEELQLDWVAGTGVLSRRHVLVPLGLVQRAAARPMWEPDLFHTSSTGLACGNDRDEALLHAMYEVIERDALFTDQLASGAGRTLIDPATVTDPYCRRLLLQLMGAGVAMELVSVDNGYDIPVCLAYLWSEDYPVTFAGTGCHSEPHIALSRAITEAAQSRLTCIAGTRDDLPSHEAAFDAALSARPHISPGPYVPWSIVANGRTGWHATLAEQAMAIAGRIQKVTGYEPICLDLSDPAEPLYALKVICPAARSRITRSVPR